MTLSDTAGPQSLDPKVQCSNPCASTSMRCADSAETRQKRPADVCPGSADALQVFRLMLDAPAHEGDELEIRAQTFE